MVFNTIESKLSNLIDESEEGIHDSKEMTIELEKKMTFKIRVHMSHPKELKKSIKELIDHFEGKLDYKLKATTEGREDSDEETYIQNIRLKKETVTEGERVQGLFGMKTNIAEYYELKKQEELRDRMNYALRPRYKDHIYQKWNDEQRSETERKREEKLQKRRNKMREKLEDAKDILLKIKDEPDFDKRSEEIIKDVKERLGQDASLDFLKFLYTIQKDLKSQLPNDQDKVLTTAKEMINNVKEEEDFIFEAVDQHVNSIVKNLDQERREDYIEHREKIQMERFIARERKRILEIQRINQTNKDKESEDDEPTPRKSGYKGRRVYTRLTSQTYHLNKECGGEATNYGKVYDEKKPCKVCREYTEDTINSCIQPKGIGFIRGKEEYHDEDCLIWISHSEKVLKQICFTCEQERAIIEEARRASKETEREEELYTDDILRMVQTLTKLNCEDQRSTGSKNYALNRTPATGSNTQYKDKA